MTARAVATALAAVAVLAGAAALVVPAIGERSAGRTLVAPPTPAPGANVPRAPARRGGGWATQGPFGARLVRTAMLRDRPGGRILRAIGPRTEFGSEHVLAVVAQRPGWLGVLTHHVANSQTAWIPSDAAQGLFEPYTLHADLSRRRLVVYRESRVVRRIAVAIGRPGTATPTGRFAVTDALVTGRGDSPYGCCALALSGRQPNVPQGWSGGDRPAIHGTPDERSIGTRATSGCLRAGDRDMRWLLARIPLGTPVRIRA